MPWRAVKLGKQRPSKAPLKHVQQKVEVKFLRHKTLGNESSPITDRFYANIIFNSTNHFSLARSKFQDVENLDVKAYYRPIFALHLFELWQSFHHSVTLIEIFSIAERHWAGIQCGYYALNEYVCSNLSHNGAERVNILNYPNLHIHIQCHSREIRTNNAYVEDLTDEVEDIFKTLLQPIGKIKIQNGMS